MNPITFEWAGRLVVLAPECMGYRSLSVLFIFAVAMALCKRFNFRRSLMLVGSACLLAIVGNLTRISLILMTAKINGDFAFGPVHDYAGIACTTIATIFLAYVADYIEKYKTEKPSKKE